MLNGALMVGSFVPGPIGVLSNGISMMLALANGDEATAIEMGIGMVARMNPCGRALLLRGIIRASKVVDVKINLERAHTAWQKGDYLTAGLSTLGAVSSAATFLKACFAAGTKLLTRRGWLPIEQLQVGDEVWSKPEDEPDHPGGWKRVEELFQRTGRIWHLHVGGEVIRTTGEHPFYVPGKGWLEARLLQPGDLLCSHDGQTVAVEECYDTGEYETVYNLCVADYHTYFVGDSSWGFSVWAHNLGPDGCGGAAARRAQQADLLEQPGMHTTRTQGHHPFFRMFRDAIDSAGVGTGSVRGRSGRMRPQRQQVLEQRQHSDLHQDWNNFVGERGLHPALTVRERGRRVLTQALRDGEITPHEIYRHMEQFYTEYGNNAALQSLRRYGRRVGIDHPSLF